MSLTVLNCKITQVPHSKSFGTAMDEPYHCDELYYEDFYFQKYGVQLPQKLSSLNRAKWDRDTIKILFVDGDAQLQADNFEYAREWEKHCRIRFRRVYNNADHPDARVSFAAGGSYSYIGKDSYYVAETGTVTMQLGWNLRLRTNVAECRGTTTHEFGHLLGFIHEHQSPNFPCKWNEPLLISDYKTIYNWDQSAVQSNIIFKYSITETNSSTYDPKSIMHYEFNPKYVLGGCAINTTRNLVLSEIDIKHVGTVYPYKIAPPPPPPPPPVSDGNLALNKPCSQSSNYNSSNSYPASNANDGRSGGANFSHTAMEKRPWWEVDLWASYKTSRAIITNRLDCCASRLKKFKITIDGAMVYEWSRPSGALNGEVIIATWTPVAGRAVRITADNGDTMDYLQLSEVEIYGSGGPVVPVVCKDSFFYRQVRDSVKVCR